MNIRKNHQDDYRSLLLMEEISRNDNLTQRDLSKQLNVALGVINSYIKNLASRGCITISTIPKKRYKYYLTPKGFREKTRLTYEHMRNFTNLYRVARKDFSSLFTELDESGIRKVAFCGVDEVTEIAYLSLKEAGLELAGVIDEAQVEKKFFGLDVQLIGDIIESDYDLIIITSFKRGDELTRSLTKAGVK
ncbi:MAG: winged helix-turn-helix transcriptional regulator, partial [Proteobacteria bacterium]|nr:winged helix-turn-helix transcriptional regulator [Pseudomonadota bacterium]